MFSGQSSLLPRCAMGTGAGHCLGSSVMGETLPQLRLDEENGGPYEARRLGRSTHVQSATRSLSPLDAEKCAYFFAGM